MNDIQETISFLSGLSEAQKQEVIDGIETKMFKKRTVLQKKGELKNKAFFVKKGLLRSYTIDDKGKEHVFMFGPEGWIVSDIESQTKQKPTELYIDALEDSEVEILDRNVIEVLRKHPEMSVESEIFAIETDRFMRRISVLQKRVIMLMSASALERYEHFLETYPQIVQRVPQKMIASYLGITPEALSKIRGQIARGK